MLGHLVSNLPHDAAPTRHAPLPRPGLLARLIAFLRRR